MVSWKRPENVPYLSIWRTFKGRKEINGITPVYWIQDATPEYKDEFIRMMKSGFLNDAVLCKYINFTDDEQSVQEFGELWNHVLEDKLALICLTKNSSGQVRLVGGNMTAVWCKDQQSNTNLLKGKLCKKLLTLMDYITNLKDVFSELGVNEYLTGAGLYVLPEFRRQGIATELLRARRDLSLAVGLRGSATVFASGASQKAASSAGFKELVKIAYEDLGKVNPDFDIPGIAEVEKFINLMFISYD